MISDFFKKEADITDIERDVEAGTPNQLHRKQKALEISIKEGSFAHMSQNLGSSYIIPFALALKANALQIGFLSSFAGLISPIAEIYGSKLMKKNTRKKLTINFCTLQALTWLIPIFISYIYSINLFPKYIPYLIIISYTLTIIFTGLTVPSWFSWMGDLVPEKDRGRYFGKRNRIVGAAGLVSLIIAALILDYFKTKGLILLGFSIIFLAAFIFRLTSAKLLKKQYSPQLKLKKSDYASFFRFFKDNQNYKKFSIYNLFFYLSLMIASPFFTVYMLEYLNFSYVTFMTVLISGTFFYLLFSPLVGKFSDRFGNTKLIIIANALFVITPLFWIFLKEPLHLILTAQLIGGFANASFIIGSTNFKYGSLKVNQRALGNSYTNLLVGIGIFVGSILGGYIIKNINITFILPILLVFIISSIMRFLTAIIFLPNIKDETHKERLPPIHIDLNHPAKTINAEIGWFQKVFR